MNPPVAAKLFVCEERVYWAAALRRSAQGSGIRIHELRTVAAAWEQLDSGAGHVLVWHVVSESLVEQLANIHEQTRQFPASCALAVGERDLAEAEPLLREAGVVHATFSTRHLDRLLQVAMRHLAQFPLPVADWQERLRQQLPWNSAAQELR